MTTTERYSDEELEEFRSIIYDKKVIAEKELNYFRDLIAKNTENPGVNLSNPGMETEQLIAMRDRQSVYIENLDKALNRIDDKTYGICKTTGKLIEKDRLRAVPHATLSMAAKMGSNVEVPAALPEKKKEKVSKKKLKVEAPIEPATEPNLEDIPDPVISYNEKILKEKLNQNDMNFFSQLNSTVPGVDLSIVLKEKNGKYTMSLLPNVGSKTTIQPLIVSGTPEELDEKFFELISTPLQQTSATLKNAEEHKKSVEESVKATPAPAHKNKQVSKSADKKENKKPAVKAEKKEAKKIEKKIEEPDLFPTA